MRNLLRKLLILGIVFASLIVVSLEIRPHQICYSHIFTTAKQTEIKLYVVMNTFMPVDEEELALELVSENQEINGVRENSIYKLILYRTDFHYRRNWRYNTIICDENGTIICYEEDLGV